jgi:hypothetical protein
LYRNSFHLSGDPACKSDAGALMQFDRRPMALPYPYGRRLERGRIYEFFLKVRSCLYMKLHSVPICTETVFIFQEILRASLMPVH